MPKVPLVALAAIVIVIVGLYVFLGFRPSVKVSSGLDYITLPKGFTINVFADNLGGSGVSTPGPNPGPRMMDVKDGVIFVSLMLKGSVVALPDASNSGKADKVVTVIDGLKNPHGLAFYKDWLYVAEEDKVIRMKYLGNLTVNKSTVEKLVGLPSGGHITRTIKIINDYLFVSAGSSCNVCYEDDPMRAAITRCDVDGKNCSVYAKGLRNAVGFVLNNETGEIWATDNGRDWLGEDLPPDEINIVQDGKNYGWPICYGKNVHDTDFDRNVYIRNPCMEPFETPSYIDLQAHSAPLGLAFYFGGRFPREYRGDLFVAYHGSWNRQVPTGYKIVRIRLGGTPSVEDFATGWLQGQNVLGRPVDIIEKDGDLYVSDDNAGKIYRISYSGV